MKEEQIFSQLYDAAEDPNCLFTGGLGLHLTTLREGYAEGVIAVTDALRNKIGSVHGGAYLALADTIGGTAAASAAGCSVTTSSCHFNFLRAAIDSKELCCKSEVVKAGARLITVESKIYDETGALLNIALSEYVRLEKHPGLIDSGKNDHR